MLLNLKTRIFIRLMHHVFHDVIIQYIQHIIKPEWW